MRVAYATPRIEICAAEPYKFLAASDTILGGEHEGGDDNGEVTGAKQVVILGQEFSFKDLWEE
ncbi:MAG: hypothetical protein IKV37_04390 [Prevotella sp.]|nr:hypothetical protein [Prevotella sp.]